MSTISYVFPSLSNTNESDSSPTYIEFLTEVTVCIPRLSNYGNVSLSQFSHRILRSTLGIMAAFVHTVSHIVTHITNTKMFWINTWRVITRMKNLESMRDGSIIQPKNVMRCGDCATPIMELSVSFTDIARPAPAVSVSTKTRSDINVLPDTLLGWRPRMRHVFRSLISSAIRPSAFTAPCRSYLEQGYIRFNTAFTAFLGHVFMYSGDGK